jgi:signal transduction histidine kinase
MNVSSAEQPRALTPERTTCEANTSSDLTQTSNKGASLDLTEDAVGKLDDGIMNGDLDIPHNRVRLNGALLAKDESGPEYVRSVTHELRTPLNAIIGLCQCLERDREAPLNETQRDTVARVERNAHALLESVNKLLERMRNGQH